MRDHQVQLNCIRRVNKLKGLNQLIATIGYGVAPTIQSIKPSSLLTLNSRQNRLDLWLENQYDIARFFRVQVFCLREGNNSSTFLFYKEENLKKQLQRDDIREILMRKGYIGNLTNQLEQLKKNYTKEFPHEIGLFLGIPAEDVKGFVLNNGKNYLLNGYWKVYNNVDYAAQTFHEYDDARVHTLDQILTHIN